MVKHPKRAITLSFFSQNVLILRGQNQKNIMSELFVHRQIPIWGLRSARIKKWGYFFFNYLIRELLRLQMAVYIQIKIKIPNHSQEHLASSKAPNENLKDMDVLCTFKIKIESQHFDRECIKDQWPYPNEDQDAKPPSGTSSILQNRKWRLKGHECSLHLHKQDIEPKFRSWVYQRTVTLS